MGLRLNKVLGYGLTLTSEEYNKTIKPIIDNFNKQNNHEIGKAYVDFVYNKYKDNHKGVYVPISFYFVNSETLRNKTLEKKIPSYSCIVTIDNPTVRSQENPNLNETPEVLFMLVPPFDVSDWNRNDDDMDYTQHFITYDEPTNVATELKFSPYPYNGTVMNRNTGETHGSSDFTMMIKFYQEGLKKGLTEEQQKSYDEFFTKHFNLSAEKALNTLTTASVPEDIQDLAELIGLTEPGSNFTHKLKPILAEFWT